MLFRIHKNDILKRKIIYTIVVVLLILSSFLIISSISITFDLKNSMDNLIRISKTPDFVQYHSGEINEKNVKKWSDNNSIIDSYQISEMINIPGKEVYINSEEPEYNSVMEIAFVRQNKLFDFLIDDKNKIAEVEDDKIGVPIFYKIKKGLKVGDFVTIKKGEFSKKFVISHFIKDSQMNPSLVSSKRFLVSDHDYEILQKEYILKEYLLSYKLINYDRIDDFQSMYFSSPMPKNGPYVNLSLLKLLNSITDGLSIIILFFVGCIILIISILSIRYIVYTCIEEDYYEIGILKAIGISNSKIMYSYNYKYLILSLISTTLGLLISLCSYEVFIKNITEYFVIQDKSYFQYFLLVCFSLVSPSLIYTLVYLYLKKIKKISSIDVIRLGRKKDCLVKVGKLSLNNAKFFSINVLIALRDIVLKARTYITMVLIIAMCVFMIILPINFLKTISSPTITNYMGIGSSDVLIYFRPSNDFDEDFKELQSHIIRDEDVEKYSFFSASKYELVDNNGNGENIIIESGNHEIFPLKYIEGTYPVSENDISLSYFLSQKLDKTVGDKIKIRVIGKERILNVTGIYQDITNGGETAKATIKANFDNIIYNSYRINFLDKKEFKINEYKNTFPDFKIIDREEYLSETFGNTIYNLKKIVVSVIIFSLSIVVFMNTLFLKLIVSKDESEIAIMNMIGIDWRNIRLQYIYRIAVINIISIVLGIFTSRILGSFLMNLLVSIVGIKKINLETDIITNYVFVPIFIIVICIVLARAILNSIKGDKIRSINLE